METISKDDTKALAEDVRSDMVETSRQTIHSWRRSRAHVADRGCQVRSSYRGVQDITVQGTYRSNDRVEKRPLKFSIWR